MTETGQALPPAGRRARLVVAYDGSGFHGFAENRGVATVMGALSEAIATVVQTDVDLTGAGRTDAGVHAWGQVVSGDLPPGTDLADLERRVNKLCGPRIAVRDAVWAEPDFDARFSATWRRYRYHVWNAPAPNPLEARTSWHVAKPLALWAMQAAGDPLVGEHDFSSFCRRPKQAARSAGVTQSSNDDRSAGVTQSSNDDQSAGVTQSSNDDQSAGVTQSPDIDSTAPSMVRRVLDLGWTRVDDSPMLRFEIRATAFCHQMVRSIVGTMVDVGLGRLSAGDVNAVLRARDRSAAGTVAPPHGLVLWEVGYDGVRWHDRTAREQADQ